MQSPRMQNKVHDDKNAESTVLLTNTLSAKFENKPVIYKTQKIISASKTITDVVNIKHRNKT